MGCAIVPLDFIREMADQFGDLVHFTSRQDPMIFVNHPELAREVLILRPHAFVRADAVCDVLRVFDGDSILGGNGAWHRFGGGTVLVVNGAT